MREMDEHEREVRRLRIEARERLVEIEEAEGELALATSSIVDFLLDSAALGSDVRLELMDRPRVGRVVHVGVDVVTLLDEEGRRSVVSLAHLEGVHVDVPTREAGPSWTRGHPGTMLAHVRSLIDHPGRVMIERRSTPPIDGRVLGVAKDHLSFETTAGSAMLVPLDSIVSVCGL